MNDQVKKSVNSKKKNKIKKIIYLCEPCDNSLGKKYSMYGGPYKATPNHTLNISI